MSLSLAGGAVRHRFAIPLPFVVGLVVYAALLLVSPQRVLGDPDTYWHIAVGRWMLAHRTVPHTDVFSHTVTGVSWVNGEWLAEVVFAWLYRAFGWSGIFTLTAACVGAAMGLLVRTLLRFLKPIPALIGAAAALLVLIPHLLARPHVIALPLMVAWSAALVSARSADRAPAMRLLPLMTLWANLHSSFFMGLVLAGLFAGEAVLAAESWPLRSRAIRQWGAFVALATGAALLTPNGLAGLLLPLEVEKMTFALSALVEWQSPNFQTFSPLEIWLGLLLLGALSLRVRLPVTRSAILLLLLHMTLQHQRHAELLAFLAPLLAAEALGSQLATIASGAPSRIERSLGGLATAATPAGAALGGVLALAVTTVSLAHHERDPQAPVAALAAAASQHVVGPVLNDYNFGGYLLFSDIPTFIDGRYMYGDAFIERYVKAVSGVTDDLPALLAQYRIGWTLLQANSPGVTLMDHLQGWRRLYADDTAVVHIRATAAGP